MCFTFTFFKSIITKCNTDLMPNVPRDEIKLEFILLIEHIRDNIGHLEEYTFSI